jgi:tRNA(adenine34) deaminase
MADRDTRWMRSALHQAEEALAAEEVPAGAVVVAGNILLGRGHNQVKLLVDPTAHGVLLAVTAACRTRGSSMLQGATLYTTVAPCRMCLEAAKWAEVGRLVYAVADRRLGSCALSTDHYQRLAPRLQIGPRVGENEMTALLKSHWRARHP